MDEASYRLTLSGIGIQRTVDFPDLVTTLCHQRSSKSLAINSSPTSTSDVGYAHDSRLFVQRGGMADHCLGIGGCLVFLDTLRTVGEVQERFSGCPRRGARAT